MLVPNKRLAGVGAKIERAHEHVLNLKGEVDAFLKEEPYVVVAEEDAQTGDKVFRVSVRSEIPFRLAAIAGDAIHNLRAALDYLIWQLVEANGQVPNQRTEFLFGNDEADFSTRCKGKILKMGVSAPAMDLIEALKPYNGGNDGLYALHRLDIRDKHRLLITVGGLRDRIIYSPKVLGSIEFRAGGPDGRLLPVDLKPEWVAFHYAAHASMFPLNNRAELYRLSADDLRNPTVEMNPKFGFQIAFGEQGIFQGEPLVESLGKLTQLIVGILKVFSSLPELT
jgi:hypothetical protein